MNFLFSIIFSVFLVTISVAQIKTDTSKKVHYLAVPVVFKSPETGWSLGVSGSSSFKTTHHNDTLTRTSVIQGIAFFTQRHQNVQAIDATIYFPKEKYILYVQASHSYFPDNFWGIGSFTKNGDREKYAYAQAYFSGHIKRMVRKNLFVGFIVDYQNVYKVSYKEGGIFETSSFYGKKHYDDLGYGVSLSYDTRNSSFWPTKGFLLQGKYISYDRQLGSTYTFNNLNTEARFFKSIVKNHIIALQLFNNYSVGSVPLRSLSSLGGSNNLRGFYQGRYRDYSMYSIIAEYRAHLFWKLGTCIFGGLGNVYHHFNDASFTNAKYSFGGGLRLQILEKEKMNIRFDYGYSDKYNNGFYFTIGECF